MGYVKSPSEPIAIVGSGCRYPGMVNSPSKLWGLLKEPHDLTKKAPASRYNVDGFHHNNGEHHGTTNAPNAYWIDDSQDPRQFDAAFFSITPKECEAIDPQGKVLLEVVYEAMESGGLTMQQCAGQRIGVFIGTMTEDYVTLTAKDELSFSQYGATGTSRAIISNRISYFFNWTGPSLTIDTACSSSLVAMHSAVQSLRCGESTAACVAGVNILLAPEGFIMESSLHMLSPDGKSKMWDQSADGYARGEGVGVFFLKTLSQALADGDQIEGVIRETGVNSDGRTKGITMPSPAAQAALIRDTYNRSGLDPRNPLHRCQYFEAHGTGTQAGDPREAEAIHTAFFGPVADPDKDTDHSTPGAEELLVGSIKTVIGHTEGAAGVAGVLKALLGLKHRLIPPNQHLVTLNPSVVPFCDRLKVPTTPTSWPEAPPGQPLRASVNSFGFGGTNAHAILERYEPDIHGRSSKVPEGRSVSARRDSSLGMPFLLSANTDKALIRRVEDHLEYIEASPDTDLQDLAWTLAHGRSNLPHRVAFPASGRVGLVKSMREALSKSSGGEIGVRHKDASGRQHRILGIFTGQGAQWATMGRDLIESSPLFRQTLRALDEALQSCPDPPTWSIVDELLAQPERSRLSQAAFSQPLCTAIQVALVDLLSASGVHLSAVVGHSSGEIGAAYASGSVDRREAILLAYYRGFHAHRAGGAEGVKGGMMAAGMGLEEAIDLCSEDGLESKIFVAASNAPASVTLSGDLVAIKRAGDRLRESSRFVRQLQVDTAYHSHHMDPCAAPYLDSLAACGIKGKLPQQSCPWVSSVYGPAGAPTAKELAGRYWRDNMVQPVLFCEALGRVLSEQGPFDMALEIGPHPALRGPATQTMQDAIGRSIPYSGLLSRGKGDTVAFSDALGMLWCHLGAAAMDLEGYSAALGGGLPAATRREVVKDLPPYPWDHSATHYREPRTMRQYLHRSAAPHELLGVRTADDSESALRWRNILQPAMLPWLKDHRFQGQIIVPAAAYCVMALDAAGAMASGMGIEAPRVAAIEIRDLVIQNGITMPDESQGVETVFSLQRLYHEEQSDRGQDEDAGAAKAGSVVGHFALDWSPVGGGSLGSERTAKAKVKNAVSGTVVVLRGASSKEALPRRSPPPSATGSGLAKVDEDDFYSSVQAIGLGYTKAFRALRSPRRRLNFATAQLEKPHPEDVSVLPVRPALLDSSFQAAFAAISAPGDGLRFNPALCNVVPGETCLVQVDATITQSSPTTTTAQASFLADIDIYNPDDGCVEIQIEGLKVASFVNASAADDRELYLQTVYKPDPWSGFNALPDPLPNSGGDADHGAAPVDSKLADLCAHVSSLYLQEKDLNNPELQDKATCDALVSASPYRPYIELLLAVGRSVPALVPGLCQEIIKDSSEVSLLHRHLTHVVDQISHRFPHLNLLEIDQGNAAVGPLTESVWDGLALSVSSYTFAHHEKSQVPSLAPGAGQAQVHKFRALQLDQDTPLAEQVLAAAPASPFDLVILPQVGTEETAREVRQLMKPGGFLITVRRHGKLLRERLLDSLLVAAKKTTADGLTKVSLATTPLPSLQDCGFGQLLHQYTTPQASLSLEITQAGSPEVDYLRSPLLTSLPGSGANSGTVYIVGGKTPENAVIRRRLETVLSASGFSVLSTPSFEESSVADLDDVQAAIVLADVDEPILQSMTAAKLAALKALFQPRRYVLWLTNGVRANQPYHTATVGMIRTIKAETPKLQLQCLDVDTLVGIEDTVAEVFLRLAFTNENDAADNVLWTVESELVLEKGLVLVPRLLPVREANDRLNSTRRVINNEVSVAREVVELLPARDLGGQILYSARSSGRPGKLGRDGGEKTVVVRMMYSSAWAIDFGRGTNLFVGLGVSADGRKVITTSPSNASWVSLPGSMVHEVNPKTHLDDASLVSFVIQALVAQRVVDMGPKGPLATLDAGAMFASLLNEVVWEDGQNAGSRSLHHTTTDQGLAAADSRFVFIHAHSTQQAISEGLPFKSGMLVDCTRGQTPLSLLSRAASGRDLLVVDPANTVVRLSGHIQKTQPMDAEDVFVADAIFKAQYHIAKTLAGHDATDLSANPTPVSKMLDQGEQPYFGVVDWMADAAKPVVERVRPLDVASILSPDKTYLLVGLTGDLGRSLARLMAENGARYIVVASRNPATAEGWATTVRNMGATVHLAPLDVTDLGAVQRLKDELHSSFPPVGGVIQGAMVLADGLFADMTPDRFQQVLKPKVTGSYNLDLVFSQQDLDFFIMFSSLTAVAGNPGQSNYTAANMYMSGLAAQRRKRGLAASVLDIGMVVGIGYINRVEGAEIYANLRRQGYRPISERDIHHMFVEAVAAGRVPVHSSNWGVSQLTTGLQRVNRSQDSELAWHSDPRMSHHMAVDSSGGSGAEASGGDGVSQTVKDLIRNSQTKEQIAETLQKSFSAQLESMLRLPANSLNKDVPIIDLGVDSLVAVEVRTWFLKDVERDMPVLKILGGDSVATICEDVAKGIFEDRQEAVTAQPGAGGRSLDTADNNGLFSADGATGLPIADSDDSTTYDYEQVALMSYPQARMWFPFLLLQDKTTYNCTTSYTLRGPLDVQRYENALHSVIHKHQVLRTSFFTDGATGKPMQAVGTTSPFKLKKVSVSAGSGHENSDSAITMETDLVARHVYDLESADVFIATLICHTPEHHTLIYGYHHIIIDGVSWQLFLQDVERFYVKPVTKPAPPPVDYIDFAVKQRAELHLAAAQNKRAFWKETFAQLPSTIPLFPFASVKTRRPLQQYVAREHQVEINPETVQRIKAVSSEHQSTPFHFYVATLQVMLHRLLGVDDVCIGVTDANRTDPAFIGTVGLLLDSLPLRSQGLHGSEMFCDRLQGTRNTIYGALGNSAVPLEVILEDIGVENSASHMPLFQITVNYRMNALGQESIGDDVKLDYLAYDDARHPFDLNLNIDEKDGRAWVTLSAQKYLYDDGAATLLVDTYLNLLAAFSTAPLSTLDQPGLYSEAQHSDAIELGIGPQLPIRPEQVGETLPALVDSMCHKYGNHVAVTDASQSYTYQELLIRSNCIATALQQKGVTKGTRVGLLGQQQSANSIFSLVAILKTGAVYIPLDERNSDQRLAAVVAESDARVIVCDKETKDRVPKLIPGSVASATEVEVLDSSTVEVSVRHSTYQDNSAPDDLAFIMFTSGSTGKPKGIMLSHANWVTHVRAAITRMNLGRETVLQQSALGYDTSLAQISYALANGGRLVMSSNRGEMDAMARLMRDESVTLTLMSPSEYAMLLQYGHGDLAGCTAWRVAMSAGEAFPPRLRPRFRELGLTGLSVWNAYGPTEISGASNIGQVAYKDETLDGDTVVPIGKVLPGYNVCLVDEKMQPVPVGLPGQLAVRGPSVSAGYLHNASLTAEKFRAAAVIHARTKDKNHPSRDRWYLTGDVARMAPDGSVLYLGRMEHDSMIKLRGIRIDLDEVSHVIIEASNGTIAQAVVGVRGDADRQTEFLVAYVAFQQGRDPGDAHRHQYLERLLLQLPLPVSMRPSQAVSLEVFPVKTSGKLDKDALQALPLGASPPKATKQVQGAHSQPSLPLTPIEKQLVRIWEAVLDRDSMDTHAITKSSNFFAAGGNSLLLLRLQAEMRKSFGIRIALPELFQMDTLESLGQKISKLTATSAKQVGHDVSDLGDKIIETKPGIDWAAETAIPESISQILTRRPTPASNQKQDRASGKGLTIILTGATGFLGRQIAQELQARPEVTAIHCIAVRDPLSAPAVALQMACPKATLHRGDLSLPRLGLNRDDAQWLFAAADAVIHNGADVSFLKPYEALRAANVGSTSEILRLSLEFGQGGGGSSVHFVSTAGVGLLSGEHEFPSVSMAAHSPAGKEGVVDGYVSSKWASEVLLEKVSEAIPREQLAVRVYRPSSITGSGAPALDIMHNIVQFSRKLRAVPEAEGSPWRGAFDFVSVQSAAAGVVGGVMDQAQEKGAGAAIEFVHLSGEEVVPVAKAREYLERGSGYEFRELGLAAWVREAVDEGLHPLVAAFLESAVTEGAAREIWIPTMQSDLIFEPYQAKQDPSPARSKDWQPGMRTQRTQSGLAMQRGMGAKFLSVLLVIFLLASLV